MHVGYLGASLLHFGQYVAVVWLRLAAKDPDVFKLPLRWTEQRGPPRAGEEPAALVQSGHLDTSLLAMAFFLQTAVFCGVMSLEGYNARRRAERGLPDSLRWLMYTAAGFQFAIIAAMCGLRDPWVLAGLGVGMAALQVFGYLLEKHPGDGLVLLSASWLLYFGLWAPPLASYARVADEAPNFVHALVATQFVLFSAFGVVAARKWARPEWGARALWWYMMLDVTSKSLNCWITLGGQLAM